MIMYQTRWHNSTMMQITKVEVAKQTEKQVTFPNGRRSNKRSDDLENFFDTFEEAKEFIIESCRNKCDRINDQLTEAVKLLELSANVQLKI